MPPRRATKYTCGNTFYNRKQKRFECKATNGTRVVLRGVRPTLKQLVWPKYTYDRATLGPDPPEYKVEVSNPNDSNPAARTERQIAAAARRNRQPHTARQGNQRGARVDAQISKICNWIGQFYKDGVTYDTFLVPRTRVPTSISPKIRNSIMTTRRALYAYTINVLKYMQAQKWVPVAAQVPVGSARFRLGTAIDVLCTKRGRGNALIVLEIKCGFDRYYLKHSRTPMTRPFHKLKDSCYYQHQLQLMSTAWLLEQCPETIQSPAFVLRAHRAGVTAYPLLADLRSATATRGLRRLLQLPTTSRR